MDLSTSEQRHRRYLGATLSLGGALGGLRALLAYTYSQQEIGASVSSSFEGPAFYQAPDPNEQRHSVRVLGAWDIARIVSLGLVYTHDSGRPTTLVSPSIANPWGDRASRGVNPGTNLNDPGDDDQPTRYPATERLNLQARFRIGRWVPFGFDLYADLLNAFDQRSGGGDLDGRWMRLGAELRY
jgi:hypothetical protein